MGANIRYLDEVDVDEKKKIIKFNTLLKKKIFNIFPDWILNSLTINILNILFYRFTNAGFKNINIQYFQRYGFSNHLGWFLRQKPGGHNIYKEVISDKLNLSYCENLKRLGQTDTLIAIAE